MKIKTQINKDQKKPDEKRKKLFFIFFSTFIAVFLLCITLVSMFTPKIDIPALNNEENLSSVNSEDFKGRIDERLKSLEVQEQTGPAQPNPDANQVQNSDNVQDQSIIEVKNQDQADNFDDQIPYDSRAYDQQDSYQDQSFDSDTDQNFQPVQKTVQKSTPKKAVTVQKTNNLPADTTPSEDLDLRDKVRINNNSQPSTMVKVIVGNYSNPTDARRASQELSGSNPSITPFIRERNGVYSLQVGSFSNTQKAQKLANELRDRNISAKVVQD